MPMPWFLELLALPPHADERAVRRAYAKRVKLIDQAADPTAFARLREAYEAARAWAADEDHEVMEASVAHAPVPATPVQDPVEPGIRDEPVTRPLPTSVSPQEQATRLVDRLAFRIARVPGADIRLELDACTAELRLQYIDAPGLFEEALIDRLASGRITRRVSLFDLAMEHFHWQEIGHVASLGPKGLWIEAVEAQRIAWNGLAVRDRTRRLALIEQVEAAPSPLPARIVRRWVEVRDDFRRYPAYLGLSISSTRLREWVSAYDALPASQRTSLDAPARKRRWLLSSLKSTYPAWGFLFLLAFIGVGRVIASLTADPQPDSILDVRIDPHRQGRPDGQAVISVTVRNMTTGPVYVPEARTPLFTPGGHLMSNVFHIVDEAGVKAPFIGHEVVVPMGEARGYYRTIGSLETLQNDVDLSVDYRLTPGHRYRVTYIQPVARDVGTASVDEMKNAEDEEPSNPVDIDMSTDPT